MVSLMITCGFAKCTELALARPCNKDGEFLEPGALPSSAHQTMPNKNDWGTFGSRSAFTLAELLYVKTQMSNGSIDELMNAWNLTGEAPFRDHKHLHEVIDASHPGGVPWQSFKVKYSKGMGNSSHPQWMSDKHEVFYRDPLLVLKEMLANPDFKDGFDYVPQRVFDETGSRRYEHMMEGDWSWEQAVHISILILII
jgi:hypothetical protein